MSLRLIALAPALLLAAPAVAQNLPPPNGLPLSQIVAGLESSQPIRVFTEIEWDDDGYWDIEFINTNNRRTSLRIDPFSGEPWSRRNR
jgi:hypothetical protein